MSSTGKGNKKKNSNTIIVSDNEDHSSDIDHNSDSENEHTMAETMNEEIATEKNEVIQDVVDEDTWEKVFLRISETQSQISKLSKTLLRDQKLLLKLHNKEIKDTRKNRRNKNASARKDIKSGFNKPTPVPDAVAALFDIEEGTLLARTVVTKMIYKYIKDNDLQNPDDKRQIKPDKKLKKLFKLQKGDKIMFENFQTHMKKLYPPSKKDLAKTSEEQENSSSGDNVSTL